MTKEQSLSEALEKIAWDYIDVSEWSQYDFDSFTNSILKAIDSRLPKEIDLLDYNEDVYDALIKWAAKEGNTPAQQTCYQKGYNQALSDVRKELGL